MSCRCLMNHRCSRDRCHRPMCYRSLRAEEAAEANTKTRCCPDSNHPGFHRPKAATAGPTSACSILYCCCPCVRSPHDPRRIPMSYPAGWSRSSGLLPASVPCARLRKEDPASCQLLGLPTYSRFPCRGWRRWHGCFRWFCAYRFPSVVCRRGDSMPLRRPNPCRREDSTRRTSRYSSTGSSPTPLDHNTRNRSPARRSTDPGRTMDRCTEDSNKRIRTVSVRNHHRRTGRLPTVPCFRRCSRTGRPGAPHLLLHPTGCSIRQG